MAKEKQIGKIIHYFDHIGVGVIELSGVLKLGDKIHVVGGNRDFVQEVASMQVEHKNIKKAQKSDVVGLKFDKKVRPGDKVYKAN